ncbi:putative helicase mov-10-B.1 isoform X1 [Scomber japonicus]|uniref:putative helicase mov-10-B.1 isoform X1 n=2 Tax=Scomber japonicus TaxID=13676 RepID=UPI0023064904|nr:putative helicase mov-10-B.1 isoform X1 [Scomber japonicus]
MPSVIDSLESGLDFIEFLGDRISNTNKKELREIYYSEFKGREGIRDPSFSNVVYALLKFNKAHIKQGEIYINVKPQVRVYCDQWRRPRAPQDLQSPSPSPQKTAETPPRSSAPSTPVTPVLTPKKKLATEIIKKLKANRKELTADKGGIEITSDPVASSGKVQFTVDRLKELFTVRFNIANKGNNSIHFTYYTALHKIRCFTLEDERRVTRVCPLFLCPGESYEVLVKYKLNHYGYFPATMYFEFCPDQPGSVPFCIVKEMEAAAKTPLAVELGPVSPYKPFQMVTRKPVDTVVVEGVPPESSVTQRLKMPMKLGDYRYPRYLKELAKSRMEDSEYLSQAAKQNLPSVKGLLNSPLKMKNYPQRFHLLLHLEEIQMEFDIRKYDLNNQTMTQDRSNKKLLTLRVPGVVENRPSVLRGDCLRASKSGETVEPITVYTGYVHRVELDSVKLGFSRRLLQFFLSNMKFDVEFTINRYPLKLQHRAVDLVAKHQLGEVLFPSGAAASNIPMPKLRMFNRQLENNPEQYAAVQRIVAGSSRPAPHLVFGPPGTGKTITLVEAMNQVSRADPSAHILACAPSNSACDLLCERLMVHMDPYQVYRMYTTSRDPRTVPKQLLKHCNWDERQDCFVFPKKKILMKYTVLVTTMVTAGRLVSGGIPIGHFTYVFVDEAGQAVEPECVIAIAGLLHPDKGQLVLAGDPKQLGPILRSPLALQYELGLSLLERLMRQNGLYQKTSDSGHFDSRFVTKLLRNYRSHPAILKIPNELFYENELQVFADQWERKAYCNWEYLPKKGFPVIFHGVMGKDEREANSPSFFNVSEIEVLVDYLTKLLETQGKKGLPKLSPKDIGIIAPYRKQVEKIQKALKSASALKGWNDLKELKVGSVEEFQGQERKIIMVSTVRSSINYVKLDKDFNIGFLSNEKRFNVAVTRARCLLIVVGNPVILNKDPTWEKFINYCMQEKGYTGFDLKDAEGEDDIVSRLANLKINMDFESPLAEESPLQLYVDPEWKNEH